MASLQDFVSTVDEAIGEGGAQNSRILTVARSSMRRLERLYSFRYMREEKVVTMAAAAAGVGIIDLGDGVKAILSGELRPLGGSLVSGEMPLAFTDNPNVRLDQKRFEDKFPVYLRGTKTAVPLIQTNESKDFAFLLLRFTQNWAVPDEATFTHPLLNEFEDLFLADVCLNLLPISRDADLQMFTDQFQRSVKSLLMSGFILDTDDWQ
jgi:hypothetical protein